MIPPTILQQLAKLRWRERWLRIAWGTTLALAVAIGVLAIMCLADWIIDRRHDTPMSVRRGMLTAQMIFWGVAALTVVVWAIGRRISNTSLALWVEDKVPAFAHRLISALQLNRSDANTKGMSPAMIQEVTREAGEHAAKVNFAGLADHRRLEWCAKVIFAVAAPIFVLMFFFPGVVTALIARQFLANRDIPRSVALESLAGPVWPTNEEVALDFRVKGGVHPDKQGELRIELDNDTVEHYPLIFKSADGYDQIFTAKIRPSSISFNYRAWLADGRTRKPLRLTLEPRPSIVKQEAFVSLPKYTGVRPDGKPYESYQPRGDVIGLPGSSVRIVAEVQKPVKKAYLETLGRPAGDLLLWLPFVWIDQPGAPLSGAISRITQLCAPAGVDPGSLSPGSPPVGVGPEMVLRRTKMKISPDGQQVEGSFNLRTGEHSYRVVVEDQYGFVNLDPPRRSIRLASEDPPVVALLPERFYKEGRMSTEDDEVEGIPVLYRSKFRVAYVASSPFGLGKALMRYRINGEGEWWPLPLKEVAASEQKGEFDLRNGAFAKSGFLEEIEFHKVPALAPSLPPGTEGGGRFDFKTAGTNLKVGDKIEFYVEVFDRNPVEGRAPGRSEIRQKTVLDWDQYKVWKEQVEQQESRLRQLEARQRGVFTDTIVRDDPTPKPKPEVVPVDTPKLKVEPFQTFVKDWQLIGPLPNVNNTGHDTAFPPEKAVTLDFPETGIKGKVRWQLYNSDSDKIDLEKFFKHSDAGVAYAVCWVHVDHARPLTLATGSDDGIKVWINHKVVLAKKTTRDAIAREDMTPIKLEAGWNELLVKVDNKTGTWAFYLELLTPQTNTLPTGLRYSTMPPKADDNRQFVRSWQLLGPFPNEGDEGRDKELPPETEAVEPGKEYDGIGGKVTWKEHQSDTGRISLDKFYERPFNEANLAYAVCWVKSDKQREATLATGSDDGIKVWINRKLKVNQAGPRDAKPGEDMNKITLNEGWNEVLVKVDNRFGKWAFYLELRDPETEKPLEGLEFKTTAPEKK